MRRLCSDLISLAGRYVDFPRYWGSHVGRGEWQRHAFTGIKEWCRLPENIGKYAILTVDMKSKTIKDKHRGPQGHQMGAKGMSYQGGMVELWLQGEGFYAQHTHYIDVVYEQHSNQTLEEAMVGIYAQVSEIRETWPQIDYVFIQSDKCSNFNSFEQIPWIINGNKTGWGGKPGDIFVVDWSFSEAQSGKDRLDCHFSYVRYRLAACFLPLLKLTCIFFMSVGNASSHGLVILDITSTRSGICSMPRRKAVYRERQCSLGKLT